MDFELSEDEVALAEGMRRLCAGRFPLDRVRAAEGERIAIDISAWSELAEAGVFSLRLPEEDGGLGLGTAAESVVFEELGRALIPGPLVGTFLAARAHLVDGAAEGRAQADAYRRAIGACLTGRGYTVT